MPFTAEQIERLTSSFRMIKPRLGLVADHFEQCLIEHEEVFGKQFSFDRVSFDLNMLLICGHAADIDLLDDRFAEIGEDLMLHGVTMGLYPLARQAMLRAFESVLGYAWTPRLQNDWGELFDRVAESAFNPAQTPMSARSQAA